MPYCPKCGKRLKERSNFCPTCGKKLKYKDKAIKKWKKILFSKKAVLIISVISLLTILIVTSKFTRIQEIPSIIRNKTYEIETRLPEKQPSIIEKIFRRTVCGNDVCEKGETQDNCCIDCGCPPAKECVDNVCQGYCGNNICDVNENYQNCCLDCGCPENYKCDDNICKRLPALDTITKSDISRSFKIYGTFETGNKLVDCTSEYSCYKTELDDLISLKIDDPAYEPKELEIEFKIPIKNIGDYELTSIKGEATFDGISTGSFSNGLNTISLPAHGSDYFTIKKRISLDLGTKTHSLSTSISTTNQTFPFTFNIEYTLLIAILEAPSYSEIQYTMTPTVLDFSSAEDYKVRYNYFPLDCSGLEGCSLSRTSDGIEITLDEPPYIINRVELKIVFPIKNIGNKRFDSISGSVIIGNANLWASFKDTGSSYTSLNPQETKYLNYETVFDETEKTEDKEYTFKISSEKVGYGKQVELPVKLHLLLDQYYNPNCYKSYFIQYKHPKIKAKIDDIIIHPSTPEYAWDNVNDIYKWVYKNVGGITLSIKETITGEYLPFRPPTVVLEDMEGDCDDKSQLIVALARSAGVPKDRIKVVKGGTHAWAEFYWNDKWYILEMNDAIIRLFATLGISVGVEGSDFIVRLYGSYDPEEWFNDQNCG